MLPIPYMITDFFQTPYFFPAYFVITSVMLQILVQTRYYFKAMTLGYKPKVIIMDYNHVFRQGEHYIYPPPLNFYDVLDIADTYKLFHGFINNIL